MSDYAAFVATKLSTAPSTGIASGFDLPASLFPHQSALAAWALRRGRAAIFADTGLGKMRMELAWADAVHKHTGGPIMIHTPLAVAGQIAAEAAKIGIEAKVCRESADLIDGINIANYERLHKFDASMFAGVVLDESGCIKHHDTKTFKALTEAYRNTQFKLPATATPAPNDWTELGTHAEFLGICTRAEMLAEFFTHDGGDTSVWRLKGHARQIFWRWVASWGAMIRKPSNLGFDDGAYNLPPLHLHEHHVSYEMPLNGMLFAMEAQTLSERREARRASMEDRVRECVSLVFGEWNRHGVETRARSSAQGEGKRGPGLQGEAERAIDFGQRSPQGVHEDVLHGEPGEIQEVDAGATRATQCRKASEIRRGPRVEGGAQDFRQAVAGSESGQTQSGEASRVQADAGAACADAGGPVRSVRDLQNGAGGAQDVSDGRSLPCDGEGARAAVLALQHGHWQVQGQPAFTAGCDQLLDQPWVIWCDLNVEQDALEKAFGALAFSIRGSDSTEVKEARLAAWLAGERPVIISKASILGWGINMQRCARMAFVGVTDSYEAYYQAVRRCWRFGQARDVHVHIFASKAEGAIVANLKRKEREAGEMADSLSEETRDAVMASVIGATRETNSHNNSQRVEVPAFLKAA